MSQLELRSVPALKKEIIRLALAAAVQLLFALWVYAFACGLVSLGPVRIPYEAKGYEFGGMVCVLTAFLPVRTVWGFNEAVDEAKKHEPLDFDALLSRLAELCRKALRELPAALVVIPLLFLVEWTQAGTLNSIPLAGVYALLILIDYLLFRRFLGRVQAPSPVDGTAAETPVLRSRDLLSLQKGARNFMILGAVEAAAVAVPLVRSGIQFKMVALHPAVMPNVLSLMVCFLLGVGQIRDGWRISRCAGILNPDDGRDLLRQKLDDLAGLVKTAREQLMMATMLAPVVFLVDVYKSGSASALPWLGLAVVYYLIFELFWRRYKKQVDQVTAEV